MKILRISKLKRRFERYRKSLALKLSGIIAAVLFFTGAAFLIATMLVGESVRKEQTLEEAERMINGVEININSYVDSIKSLSRTIMIDEAVVGYLRRQAVDTGVTNDTRYAVMKTLNAYTNIDSVFVIRNDENYMTTARNEYIFNETRFRSGEWKNDLMDKKGGALVCIDSNGLLRKKNSQGNISVSRAIYDLDTQERTGFLSICISNKMLDEVIRNQRYNDICIISEDGIVFSGNPELADYFEADLPTGKIITRDEGHQSERRMIYTYSMSGAPLEIICRLEPMPMKIPTTIIAVLVIMLAAFLISFFLFGAFFIREINHPVHELINSMEDTKNSGWLKRIDINMTSREFKSLADSYNSMLEFLNDMFGSLIEQEKSIRNAEMRVLYEQIKPHFLYNSLETIGYMALESGAPDVHEALNTLGSFYRLFLSKGDREITLENEVKIVKDYLALQKLRYGEIIMDEYDIAEDAKNCRIPKLILQPLVENSLYHGIRPLGEPGIIRISAAVSDRTLLLTVYDTGVGMSEGEISDIFAEREYSLPSVESGLSGFGLRGTVDRLRFYCNNKDAVRITSEQGEFTKIEIAIPLDMAGEKSNVQSNAGR